MLEVMAKIVLFFTLFQFTNGMFSAAYGNYRSALTAVLFTWMNAVLIKHFYPWAEEQLKRILRR